MACTACERSPHLPQLCLSTGDWTFAIWLDGVDVRAGCARVRRVYVIQHVAYARPP